MWDLALEYIDLVYEIAEELPRSEEHNLKSQIKRAATSVALNIAEGATGQTDAEQARFLGRAAANSAQVCRRARSVHRRAKAQSRLLRAFVSDVDERRA